MKKIRLGLIGAGTMAGRHLGVIRQIDWLEPAGITSRTMLKAQERAKEYNIGVCADNVQSLIEEVKPDALVILVSEDQTYSVVESVASCGLPLFIEKPSGLTPEENCKLAQLAKKYSLKTMVGFNRRYYSVFHKGIQIIREHGQLLGVVVEGHERMWRIRDAGDFSEKILEQWIFANSTHTIDLLRFFGGEPVKVMSLGSSYREPRGDQFSVSLKFEFGTLGQYNAHWYSPGGWSVTLYGQGVTVEFKPLEKGRWIDKDFNVYEIEPDKVDLEHRPGLFRQMEAFGKMAAGGKSEWPALDLEGSYKTMLLAEKIASGVHN